MKKIINLPHKNSFTRLAPSKIHGVGVFAITNIPQGTNIFLGDKCKMIWIDKKEVVRQPTKIKKLYNDFCVIRGEHYACLDNFNNLTVSWYINESTKPNVRCDKKYDFFALRSIKSGEELTADYSTYSDEIK